MKQGMHTETVCLLLGLRFGNAKLSANGPNSEVVNLAMPGHGSLLLFVRVYPYGVTAPFPQQFTSVPPEVLHEILSLHVATSPAGN